MAIYHCSIKVIGRTQGKSAVASASYRSGDKLHSNETQQTYDYTNKHGIVYSEIMLCDNAPAEYQDRETLWNAVQAIENKKDSQLAREIEFALPVEVDIEEQKRICQSIAKELTGQGMIADFSIHHPDRKIQNPHCHMMLTMRGIDANGKWLPKEKKVYALDEHGNRLPVIDPKTGQQKIGSNNRKMWQRETVEVNSWNSPDFVLAWRELVQDEINKSLERNGINERVDCRSLESQGIDREPTIHEGFVARKMEKRGKKAERTTENRNIKERNKERLSIGEELAKLSGQRYVFMRFEDIQRVEKSLFEDDHKTMQETVDEAFRNIIDFLLGAYKRLVTNLDKMIQNRDKALRAQEKYEALQDKYDKTLFHLHGREDKRQLDYAYQSYINTKDDVDRENKSLKAQNKEIANQVRDVLKEVNAPVNMEIKEVEDVKRVAEELREYISGFRIIPDTEEIKQMKAELIMEQNKTKQKEKEEPVIVKKAPEKKNVRKVPDRSKKTPKKAKSKGFDR